MNSRKIRIATGVCLTGLLALGGPSIAAVGATDGSSDARISHALAAAPKSSQVVASSPGTAVTAGDGSSVTLPAGPAADIAFLSPDGVPASLSLPAAVPVRTQVLDGGSARAIVDIDNASRPDSYAFDLSLPEGIVPKIQPDGSVKFVPSAAVSEKLVAGGITAVFDFGGLAAPWAKDAGGAAVKTHYTVDGSTVVQHIDLSTTSSYPVLADPEMQWKGYYATLTYTKSETLGMRDQGVIIAGMLVAGAGVAAFGPPGAIIGAAMAVVSAASVGIIASTASNAVGDGRCLSVDIPSMFPSIINC